MFGLAKQNKYFVPGKGELCMIYPKAARMDDLRERRLNARLPEAQSAKTAAAKTLDGLTAAQLQMSIKEIPNCSDHAHTCQGTNNKR